MSVLNDKYQPINCGFHDYLEHFATLREKTILIYTENGEQTTLSDAVIFDLTGGRNGEFVHVKTGEQTAIIRMDYIVSINDIEAKPKEGLNFC